MLTAEKALERAIKIAEEAREEWDKAPAGMRAGKILIALSGHLPGYRADIDEIHAARTPHPAPNYDHGYAEAIAHRIYCHLGMCNGDPGCFPGAPEDVRARWIEAVQAVGPAQHSS